MQNKIESNENLKIENPIIFFDGVCGLCNSFVNIIYNADNNQTFRFSPLQGETAKKYLAKLSQRPEAWSIIYIDDEGVYIESDATLRILKRLGGFWTVLTLFSIIPKRFRDYIYRLVAKHRYTLFGKYDTCRVPNEQEKHLFMP